MKRLHYLILIVMGITLSSCARSCQSLSRGIADNHEQYVRIIQYSGGKEIGRWEIYGIVNNSAQSDGYYFYDAKNRLVEISGDITLQYDYNK